MTKFYTSLRLCALTLFTVFSVTPLTFGSAPIPNGPTQKVSPEEREKIAHIIDAHIDEVLTERGDPTEFHWLPGYFIKGDSSRVACAKGLLDYIKQHELKFVTVPEKWLHPHQIDSQRRARMPVYSLYKEDPYIVIAKKLDIDYSGIMNLEQAKDTYSLITGAQYNGGYYADVTDENLLCCLDGRIGFIDTESKGFFSETPYHG
ncbi:MAG: hypothetical protein P4L31_00235, partial [Candidatus Babeliales bacterium]|nr:hypothetical protein [Candidatus Babeliales bacterium]